MCIYLICLFLVILICLYWLSRKLNPKVVHLKGCHVMVTGGSSGIGKAIAGNVLERGATVTIIARTESKLEEVKAELEQQHTAAKIYTLPLDISKDGANVTRVLQNHIEAVGPVTLLVNCAGAVLCAAFTDMPLSDYKYLMDVNYMGAVHVTHAVLPSIKSLPRGRIVFISSGLGQTGIYGNCAYSASKFALRGLAESLQMELTPHDIRVTLAFPVDTNTPGLKEQHEKEPVEVRLISDSGGLFEADEMARAIVNDSLKGKFLSTAGFEGHMLTIATCGMAPVTGLAEIFLQVVCVGVLRLVSVFYLMKFDRIVAKCKRERDEKKTS